MRLIMKSRLLAFPLLAMLLSACVTINIYFPAAAAEEAARTIVRDVLQNEAPSDESTPQSGDKQSLLERRPGAVIVVVGMLLERLVPAAHAAQADINIDTASIRAIRASMTQRQSQLAAFYRAGAIGFDNRGTVAVRNLGAVALKDRNRVNKLVADENADRNRLYREIAQANGHPEWEADVRQTFARVWVEEAPSGYWYQDSAGGWRQR
jgi:uncharacterized protein YdbL (DUF1318 family)